MKRRPLSGTGRKAKLASAIFVLFLGYNNAQADHNAFKPMVVYQSELRDGSYLSMVDKGIQQFEQKSSLTVKRHQVGDGDYIQQLSQAAHQGYSPIVVVEANSLEAFSQVARENPSTHFISLDVSYHVPNVLGLTFNHAEGSYVIGYLAGLKTKSNQVGFIGGMDIPTINNFKCGFELGLKDANATAKLKTKYINNGLSSWNDIKGARVIAQTMLDQNIDVIFPVAGFASVGVMQAVKLDKNAFSFGVDQDYSQQFPDTNIASLEKRVDIAVFASLMQLKNGIWNGNRKHFGIKQGVINVALNPNQSVLSNQDQQLAEKLLRNFKGNNDNIAQRIAKDCPSRL